MTTPIRVRADALTPSQIGGRIRIQTDAGVVLEDVLTGIIAQQYPDLLALFGGPDADGSPPAKMRVGLQFANTRPTKKDRTEHEHFFVEASAMIEVVA